VGFCSGTVRQRSGRRGRRKEKRFRQLQLQLVGSLNPDKLREGEGECPMPVEMGRKTSLGEIVEEEYVRGEFVQGECHILAVKSKTSASSRCNICSRQFKLTN